jgi:phosphotransferase system HPr (HPr) family protein
MHANFTGIIRHPSGLYGRPLLQFIQVVKRYSASVQVWNTTTRKGPANGDSPVQLLMLMIEREHHIRIEANGDDAHVVIDALRALIDHDFFV